MASFSVKTRPLGAGERPLVLLVPKSVLRKAVDRNLMKRRLKLIMRPFVEKGGRAYIISIGPEVAKLPFRELKSRVESLVGRGSGVGR